MKTRQINRAKIKQILASNPRIKTVSSAAIDWVIDEAERAAAALSSAGDISPAGRLISPSTPGLSARTTAVKHPTEPVPLPEKPLPEPLDNRAQATIEENGGKRPGLPTVLVETSGGATTTSIVGTVEVLEIDYDNINAMVGDKVFTRQVSEAVDDLLYWAKLRGSDEHKAAGEDIMKRHIELMDKRERK